MLESFRMFIYSLILNDWRKESFCSCNWYRVQPQNDWTISNWTVLALVKGATPKRLLFLGLKQIFSIYSVSSQGESNSN